MVARDLAASGRVVAVQSGLGRMNHMCWRKVLLKDIRPLTGHSNHPGLDHAFQDLYIVVSSHPEALGEEIREYDVSITRHDAQDHNRGRKFC